MAAMTGIRNIGLKSRLFTRQPLKLLPIRLMSEEKSGAGKTTLGQISVADVIKEDPYNVPEYYSYDKDSYANLEVEITQGGRRQSQPDPRIPYYHHYPWEKKAT